jgi:hypothetical protein
MRMRTDPRSKAAPDESSVMTKATLRTAERLAIKNTVLAKILGVSEPTISRMRQGKYKLDRGQKAFELAILLVHLYRSLDGIVAGDDHVAADWLKNENTALDGIPLDLIQSVSGLTNVIAYVDSRRAVV